MKQNKFREANLIAEIIRGIIFLLFLLFLGVIGFRAYLLFTYKPEVQAENYDIKPKAEYEKLKSTLQYSAPVSTGEPTGRSDPMAPLE